MKPHLVTAAVCLILALPIPALAQSDDPCTAEIARLFRGGTLDPATHPPYRRAMEVFGADGASLYTLDNVVQSPDAQISGIRGSGAFTLMIGRDTWSGPTMDGPWTAAGQMMTEDVAAAQASIPGDMADNLSETECPGVVGTADGPRLVYRFRTQVEPHPARGDSWWGALYEVQLDPDSALPLRWEMREHVASWHSGVNNERHVIAVTYDDTAVVTRP